MKIALDYDRTYNADKPFWDKFITMSTSSNNQIWIVTARGPEDKLSLEQVKPNIRDCLEDIIYCNGIAKRWHLHHHYDLDIDVWIDDKPDNILSNSTATKEVLVAWRASEEYNV